IALECETPSSGNPPACNVWVTGETSSTTFPTNGSVQAFDTVFNGNVDAFATKLNADSSALLYSSFLGGSGVDRGFGIALDKPHVEGVATGPFGHAYVAGSTASLNFSGQAPLKLGQGGPGRGGDAFVAKIDLSAPTQLAYLTYVGGTGSDLAYAIDVDGVGNVSLTGETSSTDFPTVNPLPVAPSGDTHAFVAGL